MLFLSPDSKQVRDFRARVYEEDFNIPASYLDKFKYRRHYLVEFGDHPDIEDIYKYSDAKYLNSGIEQVIMPDDMTMISGGTYFNKKHYRAGHLLYCLKQYRKQNNSWLYQDFGAFYGHVKRAIELGIPRVITCHWPHNNKIKANIENHKRKLIGKDLPYFKHLQYAGEWDIADVKQEVFYYDIEKRFEEIKQLTMSENILPMGNYETLPVSHQYGETPEKYGCVVKLKIDPVDPEQIRSELANYKSTKQNYFQERLDVYKVPASEALNYLRYMGFSGNTYDSTSLNITGTADLQDDIPISVKNAFDKLQCNLFRQNYVIAKNHWETKWHQDHATPCVHGFRLMIPIDPVEMHFEKGTITLTPGHYYFVNNSLLHKGVIPSECNERANLMAQMDSDIDILAGEVVL